jgi:hypothetical protein
MKRILLSALIVASTVSPVMAADGDSSLSASGGSASAYPADVDWSLAPVRVQTPPRGAALPSLYASLAALNVFDAYSTTKAVGRDAAMETNPLLRGAAGNSAALWAIKGGVTAGSIVVAERLWRTRHRSEAVAMMLVSNGVMAMVAGRNASVLSGR